jgi:hypothetical protein
MHGTILLPQYTKCRYGERRGALPFVQLFSYFSTLRQLSWLFIFGLIGFDEIFVVKFIDVVVVIVIVVIFIVDQFVFSRYFSGGT